MSGPVLAIGPANYAGQAYEWANAVSRELGVRAWSFSDEPLRRGGFQFDAHKLIGRVSQHNPIFRGARSRILFKGTTHVALDGFKSFFHLRQRNKFSGDVGSLIRSGRKVALIAHGTDVRSPEGHLTREPWSYFREGDEEWRRALSEASDEARRFAQASGLPLFFSTPDLAFDLPEGSWLPLCIDVEGWASTTPVLERARPRVLHLPSRRNPPIKGSQYVEPVLAELDQAGIIEWVGAGAMVPHWKVKGLVQTSDIVVDQILTGSYGVAAVEAMAAGRVVIGNLSAPVAAKMPESPEMVNATPDDFREVLLGILAAPEDMRELAQRNRAFVRRWHSGEESARRLSRFLELP